MLIAALLSGRGVPARLLLAWRAGRFDLLVCPLLLDELARVLARPKLRRRVSADDDTTYVEMLRRSASLREDPPVVEAVSPDPGDDYLIAFARSAGAQFLVSGDRHLTGLARSLPWILTPRQFEARLESRVRPG